MKAQNTVLCLLCTGIIWVFQFWYTIPFFQMIIASNLKWWYNSNLRRYQLLRRTVLVCSIKGKISLHPVYSVPNTWFILTNIQLLSVCQWLSFTMTPTSFQWPFSHDLCVSHYLPCHAIFCLFCYFPDTVQPVYLDTALSPLLFSHNLNVSYCLPSHHSGLSPSPPPPQTVHLHSLSVCHVTHLTSPPLYMCSHDMIVMLVT